MSIISIDFFIIVAIAAIIYWLMPAKARWSILLVASIIYVWFANSFSKRACIIMLFMVCVAYFSTLLFEKTIGGWIRRWAVIIAVACEITLLVTLKESAFFENWLNIDFNSITPIMLIAPVGISYFTLTLVGYILDSYWRVQHIEKNPFKFLLFSTYFPLLTSGPIVKYSVTGEEIFKRHQFSYQSVAFGAQRILWGLFKKLVISERVAMIVSAIYADPVTYPGLYVWIAVVLFVLQLYTDFSGGLDIIYGVSGIFAIDLPENFNLPFAANSLAEFWRRWHITLGNWLKEYVFYPIMKSECMVSLSGFLRKKLGKRYGKKIPTWMGLFVSWFLIGFWHGGTMNYIIGVGLWMWFIIVLGEMLEPVFKKIITICNVNTECFSWKLFQSIRTFVLFAIGLGFFPASSFKRGVEIYKAGFSVFNPGILFDGTLLQMGLEKSDFKILMISFFILAIAGIMRILTDESLREWIADQNLILRWIIWLTLLIVVLLFGKYGPEYSTASFIYQEF